MIKNVDTIIATKLQTKAYISSKEYIPFHKRCTRIANKALRSYGLDILLDSQAQKEDISEEVTSRALLKALAGYDPKCKAQFTTYFYNKARSCARVEVMKSNRRCKILNTSSLDSYLEKENLE